mmetsp:Transcript_9689/g.9499  ORF Transcript_9689/g.9499 Transcript_9689/m.9499 type:complete len:110 (+) Transcript_9689:268-597(+)
MVNEVKNDNQKQIDGLHTKIKKLEKEKTDYAESTSKVIEQLTLLSVQKDDQLQTMTSDMSTLNQSFSVAADDLLSGKKNKKASKKEKKLQKQIDDMDSKIIDLQKQLRD